MFLIQSISYVYTGLMQAIGASQKVFEFIDRKPLVKPEGGNVRPNKLQGRIEFHNVSFAYPTRPDSLVLKVRLPSGQGLNRGYFKLFWLHSQFLSWNHAINYIYSNILTAQMHFNELQLNNFILRLSIYHQYIRKQLLTISNTRAKFIGIRHS